MITAMQDIGTGTATAMSQIAAEELGLPLDVHVANVIDFMRVEADALGLRGSL